MGRVGCHDYPQLERKARELARLGKIRYSRHAYAQMKERKIDRAEIKYVLMNARINPEQGRTRLEPEHTSPSYAFEGKTWEGRRLRIVAAVSELLRVITVIDLDK